MDYIRDVLLRQHQLLSVLMTGGMQQTEEERSAEDTYIQQTAEAQMHLPAAELQRPERAGFLHRRSPVDGGSIGAAELFGSHEYTRERRIVVPNYQADDAGVSAVYVPYERASSAVPADVRVMSRSIQRDARRYDGSFSIY